MASTKITNLLNNITLHDDPCEPDKISCQDVVNYCEARFRVILQALHVSKNDNKKWMMKVLFRELVFTHCLCFKLCQLILPQELCFSYIGVAAAIGRQINIPVIIRSLGHDLYRVGFNLDSRFQAGLDFLTYLDGNLSGDGPDDPNLQLKNFHLSWWTRLSAPQKYDEYLSFMTIRDALEVHRIQLEQIPKGTPRSASGAAPFTKPAYIWHPATKLAEGPDCT